ncbi:MAG: ferritin-like domain-containing protein [Acidimicrobiales bacterium]
MTKIDVAHALDQTLSDLITLDLVVRQARGNLVGMRLHRSHLLLDQLADVARESAKGIAARSMTLGHKTDLWADTATRKNALRSVDVKPLRESDAIAAFENLLETITTRLHVNIDVSARDLVTQGLLIRLADRIENLAWMMHLRAAA